MMDLIKFLTAEKNVSLLLNTALPLHSQNYAALKVGLQQYPPLAVEAETNNSETDDPRTTNTNTSTDEDGHL